MRRRDPAQQLRANRRYRDRHRDKINAKRRAKYAADPEKVLARQREKASDPARRTRNAERCRRYREANRERLNVRERTPEEVRRHTATRRARQARVFVEEVDPLVVLERDDGVCGICGGDVDPFDFHVDYVIAIANGGEHSYANVQAAHPVCNWRKATADMSASA